MKLENKIKDVKKNESLRKIFVNSIIFNFEYNNFNLYIRKGNYTDTL